MNASAPIVARGGVPLRVAILVGKLLAFFWALHLLTFCLFDLLPGAQFIQAGWAGADPALLTLTRERLGLTGNSLQRYWSSLSHLLHGDFGRSVAGGYAVRDLIAARLLNSLPQWLGAFTVCLFTIPLGMAFFSPRIGTVRRLWLFTSHAFLVPQFLAALAFFALYISAISPWIPQELDPTVRVVFAILSASLLPAAMLFIATANSARSYAQEPFTVTYLAMGMSWMQIRLRLLRNVAIALRPLTGRALLAVATGTLFAELTFSINGVGKLFVDSLRSSDWPTMQAWMLFVGMVIVTASLFERKRP